MATFSLTAQDVNGDPLAGGGNINITTSGTTDLIFNDIDNQLGSPVAGETVSLDGGVTFLTYTFLGFGDVRNDPNQSAGFIRVAMPDGSFQTFAVDMNDDGDGLPNLDQGNTKLTVADLDDTITASFPVPPCFVSGTLIATARGLVPVEEIIEGDLIQTRDSGLCPVRWHCRTMACGLGDFAPIRFAPGTFGNDRPLLVSPQHRMLLTGPMNDLYFGTNEVLVAALDLVNGSTIQQVPQSRVTYHHLLFDTHEVILSEGIWSESFHPGDYLLKSNRKIREELATLFPELHDAEGRFSTPIARLALTGREAKMLWSGATGKAGSVGQSCLLH